MANQLDPETASKMSAQRKTFAGGRPDKLRPCPHCKGLYSGRVRQIHMSRCDLRPSATAETRHRLAEFKPTFLSFSNKPILHYTHTAAPARVSIIVRELRSSWSCRLRIEDISVNPISDEVREHIIPKVKQGGIARGKHDSNRLAVIALQLAVESLAPTHGFISVFTDNAELITKLNHDLRKWDDAFNDYQRTTGVQLVVKEDLKKYAVKWIDGPPVEHQDLWIDILFALWQPRPARKYLAQFCKPNNDLNYYDSTMEKLSLYKP